MIISQKTKQLKIVEEVKRGEEMFNEVGFNIEQQVEAVMIQEKIELSQEKIDEVIKVLKIEKIYQKNSF